MADRHVAVGCFYHVPTQSILLHLRSPDAEIHPGMWAMFGGRSEPIDLGRPEATWQREVHEELGVLLDERQFRQLDGFAPYPGPVGPRHVFVCEWAILQADFALTEGQGLAWFRLDDALQLRNMSDFDRAAVTHIGRLPRFWFRTD